MRSTRDALRLSNPSKPTPMLGRNNGSILVFHAKKKIPRNLNDHVWHDMIRDGGAKFGLT
jgi:hypothetical protein